MDIWLKTEEVIGLGVPRATLFWQIQKGKLTTRAGEKAQNGKRKTEILLDSLPISIQRRWMESQISSFDRAQDDPERKSNGSDRKSQTGGGDSTADTHGGAADPGTLGPDLPAPLPTAPQGGDRRQAIGGSDNLLNGMTEEDLEKLNELAALVRGAAGKPRARRAQSAWKGRMSLTKLDRKIRAFETGGIAALVRKPRADRGRPRVADGSVVARVQAEYLQPHRPTAQAVYEKIKKDFEMSNRTALSFTWVLRRIEAIPKKLISRYRLGEKHYRDNFEYSSTRRRPERPRQWADADHHEADHYVVFPDGSVGRPFITALHDLCTGEILALRIPRDKRVGRGRAPGAMDIGLTVRQAILKKPDPQWPSFGLFDVFYHDLGKDFLSSHLRALLADLNIKPARCRGYHGQSKPIERWFRTLEDGTRELPGYCGNKPENNPYRSGVRPQAPDPKTLMTLEEYEQALIAWVVKKYHHAPSKALGGLSPIEALAAHVKNGFAPREVRDERALDLLLMRRARRAGGELIKVRKDGFRLFGRLYFHPELSHLAGEEIDPRYDDDRMGEIVCYYKDRFVCVATNKELLDFDATKEDLARANEIRREQRRRNEESYEELVKRGQYKDLVARAVAERNREEVMEEERKKIAVGASAEGVPVLMPKYQQAQKAISRQRSALSEVKSRKGKTPAAPAEKNPYLEDKRLTSREIFKRERNEYLEED